MIFSKFIDLCNHHHIQVLEYFCHPPPPQKKKNSSCFQGHFVREFLGVYRRRRWRGAKGNGRKREDYVIKRSECLEVCRAKRGLRGDVIEIFILKMRREGWRNWAACLNWWYTKSLVLWISAYCSCSYHNAKNDQWVKDFLKTILIIHDFKQLFVCLCFAHDLWLERVQLRDLSVITVTCPEGLGLEHPLPG